MPKFLHGLIDLVFPDILRLTESREEEYKLQAEHFIRSLSVISVDSELVSGIFSILRKNIGQGAWKQRAMCDEVMFFVFFNNSHVFTQEQVDSYVKVLVNGLSDGQIELRTHFSYTLSGVLQCCPEYIPKLKAKFEQDLLNSDLSDKSSSAVEKRHSCILGIFSIVLTYPYDLPDWMPAVLHIAARFVGDRNPVQKTVRKLFSEFKKSHSDTWHQDRLKFTEEQLDAVTELLVSPSYYV